MKKCITLSFFIVFLMFFAGCMNWFEKTRNEALSVLVIDSSKILQETKQGQKILKKIAEFDKKLIDALNVDQKIVFAKEKDFLKSSKNYQEQQEFLQLQRNFFENVEKAKDLILKHKKNEIMNFGHDVMTRWSAYEPCDLVLDATSELVLYSKNSVDVTDKIIQNLQQELLTHEKCYETEQEVQDLFKKLGLIYLKNIKVDDSLKKDINNAYTTEYYLQNQQKIDNFSQQYQQKLREHVRAPFCIKWISDQVGFGVFATQKIQKGQFIQEYTGILKVPNLLKDDTSYTWDYPALQKYQNKLHLDSKYQGNEMRFVNHSDNPNTVRSIFIGNDNLFHVCYVAKDDIQPEQQILVSYGKDYWSARKSYQPLNL